MAEQIPKHSNRPRIIVELPGYWALSQDMRDLVDARMKYLAEMRDAKARGDVEEEPSK